MKKFLLLPKSGKAVLLAALLCCTVAALAFENNFYVHNNDPINQISVTDDDPPTAVLPVVEKFSGYALYIDSNFIAAAYDKADIEAALDRFVSRRASSLSLDKASSIAIVNDCRIAEGKYEERFFADAEQLARCLGIQGSYAADFKLTNIFGESVDCTLQLSSTVEVEREEVIEHTVRNIYTNSFRAGKTFVSSEGADGLIKNTYKLEYLDGQLVDESITDSFVIEQAKDEVLMVGTSEYKTSTAFDGGLQKPYLNGRISSPFGPRSLGYHYGVDIIALAGSCYGDDIYAAADGVITKARPEGGNGYGKYVEITHDNGIVTLYAHMSQVNVAVGDTVKAGDIIGLVGSTGYTTGPHLHFEVSINGEKVDPELFVEYPHVSIE